MVHSNSNSVLIFVSCLKTLAKVYFTHQRQELCPVMGNNSVVGLRGGDHFGHQQIMSEPDTILSHSLYFSWRIFPQTKPERQIP